MTACLVLSALLLCPICHAQERLSGAAGGAGGVRTASAFIHQPDALTGRTAGAEITAFSGRELAFGVFVLLVAFVGLLVLLPPGLKSRDSDRQRHRGI